MSISLDTEALFDLSHTKAAHLFSEVQYPYEILPRLKSFLYELCKSLEGNDDYTSPAPNVYIHKDAVVSPSAYIEGPTVIGAKTEVRPGAFIRGSALIGDGCVIGNSTEVKNAVIFDGVQVPHYNYVGDSILGYKSHMGAGSIASNFRSDKEDIFIREGEDAIATGMRKLGVLLGDYAEVGCNSVLCPGSVVGRGSIVYPLSRVRGVIPACSIFKDSEHIVPRHMKD